MNTYASGKSLRLTRKLNPADTTMYGNLSVWVTAWRIFLQNDNQKEWISFTGNSLVGTEYVYTGLTRWLSQTADPATAGTGLTWLANQQGVLVSMHDQIIDKSQGITPVSITTTQRDALTPSNGAFIYNTTAGLPQIYYGGAWYDFNTSGTATPNASATVAGKVEIATTAQSQAGTDTGETGALLSALPSDIAANEQSGRFTYATDASANDTYLILPTPALTAYRQGMTFRFKTITANTGACTMNISGLGDKTIKTFDGSDTATGDILAGRIYTLVYDGTNFVLQSSFARATDADIITATSATVGVTAAQLRYKTGMALAVTSVTVSAGGTAVSYSSSAQTAKGWVVTARRTGWTSAASNTNRWGLQFSPDNSAWTTMWTSDYNGSTQTYDIETIPAFILNAGYYYRTFAGWVGLSTVSLTVTAYLQEAS